MHRRADCCNETLSLKSAETVASVAGAKAKLILGKTYRNLNFGTFRYTYAFHSYTDDAEQRDPKAAVRQISAEKEVIFMESEYRHVERNKISKRRKGYFEFGASKGDARSKVPNPSVGVKTKAETSPKTGDRSSKTRKEQGKEEDSRTAGQDVEGASIHCDMYKISLNLK